MNFLDNVLDILSKFLLVSTLMILSPLILAIIVVWLMTDGFAKKCKYYKICRLYSPQSETCNENGGEYPIGMFEAKLANCYVNMEKNYNGHYR